MFNPKWPIALAAALIATAAVSQAGEVKTERLGAQSPQEIEQAASKVIRKLNIQAEPPGARESTEWRINFPAFDIGLWILWAALAAGVAAGIYSISDQLGFWGSRRPDDWQDALSQGGARAGAGSLAEASASADELAAQGLYMEAIHLLLLRSLNEMRMRLEAQFADSLTSREILRAAELPADGRSALQDIVARVELTYFGERPAAAADYAACRLSFDTFVKLLESGRTR